MRRIISYFLSIALILGVTQAKAEENEVWRNIDVIADLLEQCSERGINTCYEEADYNILNRFITYYDEDAANGVSQERLDYNNGCLNDIYNSAKQKLEGYLSGTIRARSEPVSYETGDYNISGGNLVNNDGVPFFSNGYGHFETVREDIKNLNGFGAYNVQIEEGMKYYIEKSDGIAYWKYSVNDSMDASLSIDGSQGVDSGKSLKISNATSCGSGVYMQIYQDVFVEPNTTYEYGVWVKGSNVNKVWMSATGWDNRKTIAAEAEWTKKSYTFTTGADTYSTTIRLLCEGITDELWVDGFYMKKADGENVILNNGFEEETESFFEVYPCNSRSKSLVSCLKSAEKNNVSVCLNLSPHYFPEFMYEIYPEIKGGYGLMRFNVDHPAVREVLAAYIKAIMDVIKGCPAVTGICLTNEPTFSTVRNTEYFNPYFREYLLKKYTSIENLNSKYGSEYASFEDIVIPNSYRQQPIFYDWMNYNEEFFSGWHVWMRSIVKQYDSDMPVYSKMMSGMTSNSSAVMERGSDYTLFAAWGDMMGFDGGADIYDDIGRIKHLAVQDMMTSVSEKPLYNSENHLIPDEDVNYTSEHARHIYNQLWQGAIHGLDASTVWVWARSEKDGDPLAGSILNRPDCLRAAAYAGMDLNRNMNIVTAFQEKNKEVGILYSEASNLYDTGYKQKMMDAYEALLYNGIRCGFVNEERIDLLGSYDALIVPHAAYTEDKTAAAVKNFADGGGKLIFIGDECLGYDEFKQERNTAELKKSAQVISDWNLQSQLALLLSDKIKYRPFDADSKLPSEKIAAETVVLNNETYINVCNYDSDASHTFYLKGSGRIPYYDNMITELPAGAVISLNPLESVLLRVKGEYTVGNSSDIRLVSCWRDNAADISWKNPSSGNVCAADVLNESGESVVPNGILLKTGADEINGFTITGLENDTAYNYIVKIVTENGIFVYPVSVIPRAWENTYTADGFNIAPWKISSTSGFSLLIDSNEKYSGESSLKITGNRISGYFTMLQDKWYGNDTYEISFMAKADNVDGAAQVLNRWYDPRVTINGNEWKKYTIYSNTGSEKNPNPRIIVDGSCDAVWIDDIIVKKYEDGTAVGNNLNPDGGFELGAAGVCAVSGNESLTLSWRNPKNDYIDKIEITDEWGRKISDVFDTGNRAVNTFTVDGLQNGRNYKFNVIFTRNGVKNIVAAEGTPNSEDKNKVTENGFLLRDWSFVSNTKTISAWLDNNEKYSGKSSLKIISNYNGEFGQLVHTGISLDEGKSYLFSFRAKTENLQGKFECCNDWGNRISITGSGNGWQEYTMEISGQSIFYLRYVFETSGVMWLDLAELYEIADGERTGENLLSYGDFELLGTDLPEFSLNGNKLSAAVNVFNCSNGDADVSAYLAVFSEGRKMLRASMQEKNIEQNSNFLLFTDFYENENAELFIWEKGHMRPLGEKFIYKASEQ